MFDSLEDLSVKLAATGYFIDSVMTRANSQLLCLCIRSDGTMRRRFLE
jgi:hypothetical protein